MFDIETLNHPTVNRIGWTLIHFLWQGTLIGLVVAVTQTGLRRHNATVRYLVGIVGLVVMVVCPLVTLTVLSRAEIAMAAAAEFSLSSVREGGELTELPVASEVVVATSAALPFEDRRVRGDSGVVPFVSERLAGWTPWVASVWFLGAAFLSLRLLLLWLHVQRISKNGTRAVANGIQRRFDQLCVQFRLRRVTMVFESSLISVPATIGWLRPIVLLPASAMSGLTETQMTAILAHELAHVRRHDYAVNLLQGVVETLLFYHPAVWLVSSWVRIEREHCCDDEAVAMTGRPIEYARALTALASFGSAPQLATAVTGGELSRRVLRLVRPSSPTPSAPRFSAMVTILTLALVCVSISSSAAMDQGATEDDTEVPQESPSPVGDYPTWVMAKHVIIFEGKTVVDWSHVEEAAKAINESGKKPFPTFHFTDGWLRGSSIAKGENYGKLIDALVELDFRGTVETLGVDRRNFDSVRGQTDLMPDPKWQMSGRVLTPNGEPAAKAQVVLLPKPKLGEKQNVRLTGIRLRTPLSENMVAADESGGFTAHPKPSDERVLVLHRKGFLLTDTKRLMEKKPLRLQQWVTFTGSSIDNSGLSDQVAILTAEMDQQLRISNNYVQSESLSWGVRYQLTMPSAPTLRVERWIFDVGNIGAVPAGQWKPKPGDNIQFKLAAVSPEDIETAQQLDAARRHQRGFVRFNHTQPVSDYRRQLDDFGIQPAAYFADEGRLVYLSQLSGAKPNVKTVQTTVDRQPLPVGNDRRKADSELFRKAGIDVSKASLFYFYPGRFGSRKAGVLGDMVELAEEQSGVSWHELQRCDFNVQQQDDKIDLVVSRFILVDSAKSASNMP